MDLVHCAFLVIEGKLFMFHIKAMCLKFCSVVVLEFIYAVKYKIVVLGGMKYNRMLF